MAPKSGLLYRNRYRVPSARLQGWDYGLGGAYFVTICTLHRICYFGEIDEIGLLPSPAGEIVAEEWEATPRIRPHVHLDAWVLMPNHFHGILFIDSPRFSEKSRPLGTIIGKFKGACTHRIWAAGRRDFAWQPRFHDHIIRDEESLLNLRKYIQDNPLRWKEDRLHPDAPDPDPNARRSPQSRPRMPE